MQAYQKTGLLCITAITGFMILIGGSSYIVSPALQAADTLQPLIDRHYGIIDAHHSSLLKWEMLARDKKANAVRMKETSDSLQQMENVNLEAVCQDLKKPGNTVRLQLKQTYAGILKLESQLNTYKTDSARLFEETVKTEQGIQAQKTAYQSALQQLQQATARLNGAGIIKVKTVPCRFFIANKKEYTIAIRGSRNRERGQSFNELMNAQTVMITNGGMFAPGYTPQGLLIENGKEIKPLDTTVPIESMRQNFYMQPNGVFSIGPGGTFHVRKTAAYAAKQPKPEFATQSGPMLVFNDTINKNFTYGSSNLKIRSGVGEIGEDKIVFIISDAEINFYDFALLFRELFGCKNALYLDGAISKMYLNQKLIGVGNPVETSGSFGPVISITKTNK